MTTPGDGPAQPATPTITDVVEEAGDDAASVARQMQSYEDAMEYFLADENDLEENPLEDDVTIYRFNVQTNEEEVLIVVPIRTLEDHEIKQLRKRSKEKGPGGVRTDETDEMRFFTLVCAEASNFPTPMEKAIIKKHNTLDKAMQRMLLPGERTSLAQQVLLFSGFGALVQSQAAIEVEAAKN